MQTRISTLQSQPQTISKLLRTIKSKHFTHLISPHLLFSRISCFLALARRTERDRDVPSEESCNCTSSNLSLLTIQRHITPNNLEIASKVDQYTMSMYNHRGLGPAPGTARLNELLDGIRAEFDTQQRASGEYEHNSESHITMLGETMGMVNGRIRMKFLGFSALLSS